MQGEKAVFGSEKMDWGTPEEFLVYLKEELGFEPTLDVAASHHDAKAPAYYTEELNGLLQPWEGVVWCNPPYGRHIRTWIEKAIDEIRFIRRPGDEILMLIPARTDTKFFHDAIWKWATDIYFIKGRMNFTLHGREKLDRSKGNAPFPSMLVRFTLEGTQRFRPPTVSTLEPTPHERGWSS